MKPVFAMKTEKGISFQYPCLAMLKISGFLAGDTVVGWLLYWENKPDISDDIWHMLLHYVGHFWPNIGDDKRELILISCLWFLKEAFNGVCGISRDMSWLTAWEQELSLLEGAITPSNSSRPAREMALPGDIWMHLFCWLLFEVRRYILSNGEKCVPVLATRSWLLSTQCVLIFTQPQNQGPSVYTKAVE